jgi:hypothetical protein
MKLNDVKKALATLGNIEFQLPDGSRVPVHFHVTEVGSVSKRFIDCGGTVRTENVVSFQLWEAHDYDHRLAPEKLLRIIELSEKTLGLDANLEVEVEYQGPTIGKYGLEFNGDTFLLTSKTTACLAEDQCGIPAQKPRIRITDLGKTNTTCKPGGGCC